jgi:hypothetical protein
MDTVRPVLRIGLALGALLVGSAGAQVPPQRSSAIAAKAFRHPDVTISGRLEPVDRLPSDVAAAAIEQLDRLGVPYTGAMFDRRAGRWATLMPALRLLQPGDGVAFAWQPLPGAASSAGGSLEEAAWLALEDYLAKNYGVLGIDVAELAPARVTVHDRGDRIQIYAARQISGIPVRDAHLTAVFGHGNLILLGVRHWGDVRVGTDPDVDDKEAAAVVAAHLEPMTVDGLRRPAELILVPTAAGRDPAAVPVGAGYRYRLAWLIEPELRGHPGRWQALVDAHSGELLFFSDTRNYATPRTVVGGVFPVSNDGAAPEGVEQAGFPMPYADVSNGGQLAYTDSGGNHPVCVDGEVTTTLDGRYIRIDDFCGAISESSAGNVDLGTGSGQDCDVPVPGVSSSGNTHAARTAYYHLNRVAAQARAHLPGNSWLLNQLTAAVNIPDLGVPEYNCNAFWDETTVNFFTSGEAAPGLVCSNTGEIAGVLDHEWAHGLDDNDAVPTISSPGEGIADVYAALWLDDSCIARGFYLEDNLCGDIDPCTGCNGVRDIDWAMRASGQPHDIPWIDAQCEPPFLGDVGPCGGDIYCESAAYSEAIWDLVHRDLQAAPFNMDLDTALEVGTRLTYLGAGGVGAWYQCDDGTGTGDGCNADGGYLNFLAIDDDNGTLADGTPHMTAIFAAFDRHGIACATPTVQNSGCAGAPTTAPTVTATPIDRGAVLSWPAVASATKYKVFRSDGVFGCDSGKVNVGETTSTEFIAGELLDGLEYSFIVIPVGSNDSCLGPASSCTAVTSTGGAGLAFDESSISLDVLNGDLDPVIDNCEQAIVRFDVVNVGTGGVSNVELVDVQVLSHPGSVTVTSSLPEVLSPVLSGCGRAPGSFAFTAEGLTTNDTLEFRVDVTADEMPGRVVSQLVRLPGAETSLERHASTIFDFDSGLDGWQVTEGTFQRTDSGGGAQGTSFYVASSGNLANQCDAIRSPMLRLAPTSTMSLWTHYDIEPSFDVEGDVFWFDRANVGLHDVTSGTRTPVIPDGGRTYNAGGLYGTCGTENQEGWADVAATWAESTWSAAALGAGERAGDFVQLDVRYGTDVDVEGAGFWFDQVTVTDIELVVDDSQADVCVEENSAPIAVGDPATAATSAPVVIPVLANDSDPDVGDTLRVLGVTQPAMGTAVVNPIGPGLDTVTYVPGDGPGGLDTFLYSVTDGRGGSAIATVTVDRTFIFYCGFETGGTSVWSSLLGTCDPDGTYTLTSPASIQYSCCLGLVNLEIDQFTLAAAGTEISSSPSNPVALLGSETRCPAGTFSNTGALVGGCTETYTLDGTFTGPNTWTGTYTVTFTGPECSCFDLDPCLDQMFSVSAAR